MWPLGGRGTLTLGTGSGRMARAMMRIACTELVARVARRGIGAPVRPFRTLSRIHARAHRHRTLAVSVAPQRTGFPRRALAATIEIGPRTLCMTVMSRPHLGAMAWPAVLSLRSFARSWRLWAFAPSVAIATVLARSAGTALAITRTFSARSFRCGSTRAFAVAFHLALGPRLAIAIGTRFFAPRAIGSGLTARALVATTFGSRARLTRATPLATFRVGPPAFGAALGALRVARWAHFIGEDASVAVAVEFAKDVAGLGELVLVDRPVAIGIERGKEARHWTRAAAFG